MCIKELHLFTHGHADSINYGLHSRVLQSEYFAIMAAVIRICASLHGNHGWLSNAILKVSMDMCIRFGQGFWSSIASFSKWSCAAGTSDVRQRMQRQASESATGDRGFQSRT